MVMTVYIVVDYKDVYCGIYTNLEQAQDRVEELTKTFDVEFRIIEEII